MLTQMEAMHVVSRLPTSLTSTISGVDFEFRKMSAVNGESLQLGRLHILSPDKSANVIHPVVLDGHTTVDFS